NSKTDDAPIFGKGTLTTTIDKGNAVPFVCDWNSDGKKDLIVGCDDKNLRLFLNIGSNKNPIFGSFTTINLPLDAERNLAPCIVDWNRDYKNDILVGCGYGELYLFINFGSNDVPVFTEKKVLVYEDKSPVKTSGYASPYIVDWDNNGSIDLLIGGEDGKLLLSLSSPSNSPPSLVVNTPIGTQSGNINISYTLRDDDSDLCSIEIKFSKDGGFTWQDATSGNGGDGKTGISSSFIGIPHIFVWDSQADLGQGIYNIILKLTPQDEKNPGEPYKTQTFPIDNTTKTNLIPIPVAGKNIDIGAYSIPFVYDWNNDGRKDLLVGDEFGYVYLFLNYGTDENPLFTSYSRLQARESTSTLVMKDLKVGGFSAPYVIDYNNDTKKDLLVGDKFGYIYYFENIESDDSPILQKGARIKGGSDLDVGNRAYPCVIDYNTDGKKDLVVGDEYGYIRLYLNYGSDYEPLFATHTKLLLGTGNTEIKVCYNSTPIFVDWNKNGKRDLLVGDRDGYLWLFLNYGNDLSPQYDQGRRLNEPYVSGNASPYVVDWDNNGLFDLLIGSRDGIVYLYQLAQSGNTPPSCIILPITPAIGTTSIKYKLYDIDGDTCSIFSEYSLNGIDWKEATGGLKKDLIGSSFGVDYEFVWNSFLDLPQTKTLVYFKITPKDNSIGSSSQISFLLDNLNSLPCVQNLNLSSNSSLIEVSFLLSDLDNDTITLSFDYILNGGTWTKASVYGESSFSPGLGKLYWASSLDLPETETSCIMRLTPYDNWGIGIFQTKTLKIKNSNFSSKEVGTANVGLPINFSPTSLILKSIEYPMVITVENLLIPSSIPGLSDCGRRISAVRKDMPHISIDSLNARLTIPYNDQFAEEIEKSFVVYKENSPLASLVDTASNTVSADISSTGVYRIDTLFTKFDVKVYPNPCKSNKITFSGITGGRIRIFTLTGQLVRELPENRPDNTWDTKNRDGKEVA
ncbi:MAG: VCBS repeat-containing protein, partial [bacterium]